MKTEKIIKVKKAASQSLRKSGLCRLVIASESFKEKLINRNPFVNQVFVVSRLFFHF